VIPNAPIAGAEAATKYPSLLNIYEMQEVREFEEVYYLGPIGKKVIPSASSPNYGYDDADHHYKAIVGDHIGYRFEIRATIGKGAFGQVLRCFDHKTRRNVALKMIVNTELMHDQGRVECAILQHLNRLDPSDAHHIIRGLDFFVFRTHICVTFEVLGANLYEYSRSMRFRPIPPRQAKPAARQMLEALAFCHSNKIVHCDMKPENVLIDHSGFPNVTIIDFGSSCAVGRQRYEYIQSRFYRAPEVILGFAYGPPMDVWSVGLIIIELIIGRPLFPGETEREVLGMMTEVLGRVPDKLREQAPRRKIFFTPEGRLIWAKGQKRKRPGRHTIQSATQISDLQLLDLLQNCLKWDQDGRITAQEALNHPWFSANDAVTPRVSAGMVLPVLIR
jgi:dual specificity tyrosine-phosphorylation-regulated kinase 2/3/4